MNAVGQHGASWLYADERAHAMAKEIHEAGGRCTGSVYFPP